MLSLQHEISLGTLEAGFAIVRPPSHHCSNTMGGGFCFFNHNVMAARAHQRMHPDAKVLIFDWDVHCGDGTYHMLCDDPSVLAVSIHRYDDGTYYPGEIGSHLNIGDGKGEGRCVNVPFNGTGIGDLEYKHVMESVLLPIIREFGPDLIIIGAGFDSARGDPLGEFDLTPNGFVWMTEQLREVQPKCLAVLEGGYRPENIKECGTAVLESLMGKRRSTEIAGEIKEEAFKAEERVREAQSKFWECLKA